MKTILAFDVYGTLIDTLGISTSLEKYYGELAGEFAREWRKKQLEFSFRRALMDDYVGFSNCTREALESLEAHYCATSPKIKPLSQEDKDELMRGYASLPAFKDVRPALEKIKKSEGDFACWAFSNGEPDKVEGLLQQAGILDIFSDIVSVAEVKSFKPSPAVYNHFAKRANATATECILISSNPFDILGALNCHWRAIWLRRDPQLVFDQWRDDGGDELRQPTHIISTLEEIPALLADS